jgi:hypothetical protein
MKYFVISAVILLLGCSMPGVGELEERVDSLETEAVYDDSDIIERVDQVEGDIEILDERVTVIEHLGMAEITQVTDTHTPPVREIPEEVEVEKIIAVSDIAGLQDSMNVIRLGFTDSLAVLDESIVNLGLSIDSLTMENDSLKADMEDLQDQINSLSYTVDNMRYTATTSSSSSGTPGRGTTSTGGGSTGGTSGSGTR